MKTYKTCEERHKCWRECYQQGSALGCFITFNYLKGNKQWSVGSHTIIKS